MKSWMNSVKLVLAGIAVFMLCSCATPQEKYISNLEDLTEQIEKNGNSYNAEQWESALDKYQKLVMKAEDMEFTTEQKEEIGELEGRCMKAFGKAMGNQVKNVFKGLGSQVKGFLQGLSGADDDDDLDDIKDSFVDATEEALDEAADGAKEAVEEVSKALKEIFE